MKLFRRKRDPLRELDKILRGAAIPHFPQATMRILGRIRDPDSSMEEVSEALRWEPGLVVRLLATVNSAAFGPAQVIQDVGHAASYLGRAQIEQIVLGMAVRDVLPHGAAPGFVAKRYWLTAARRATLARLLADQLHPTQAAESFTIGLLQDMAVPVLAHARPDDYGPVLCAWHAHAEPSLEELERSTFGWSHAEVGGMLAHAWKLPAALTDSIAGHHSDDLSDRERLPAVRLVSVLRETEHQYGIDALLDVAHSEYGLAPEQVARSLKSANEIANELAHDLA